MPLYSIETYGELEPGSSQEWSLTNGLGGYAASTVVGKNTLRYHGLLCAATLPPVGRQMLLNRVAEAVTIGDRDPIELSINQFPDRIAPRGDRYLKRFKLGQTAVWEYDLDDVCVTKDLLLCWQRNTAVLRYTIEPKREPVTLSLNPFLSLRDFHSLRHKDGTEFISKVVDKGINVRDREISIQLRSDRATFIEKPEWWFNHQYDLDRERGAEFLEDLYTPGRFSINVSRKPASCCGHRSMRWTRSIGNGKSARGGASSPCRRRRRMCKRDCREPPVTSSSAAGRPMDRTGRV